MPRLRSTGLMAKERHLRQRRRDHRPVEIFHEERAGDQIRHAHGTAGRTAKPVPLSPSGERLGEVGVSTEKNLETTHRRRNPPHPKSFSPSKAEKDLKQTQFEPCFFAHQVLVQGASRPD